MAETVVALDLPSAAAAERLLDRLDGVRWVKVGSILMTSEGPMFVRRLLARGLEVFLDLKWHDIPNTVAGAVAAARDLGVSMATVHVAGGARMIEAAAAESGGAVALVGVTVLTSHDAGSYAAATGRERVDIPDEVERLAAAGVAAGLAGIVCSPGEAARVRGLLGPGALIVVPGIRRRADPAGDQSRTATPGAAARAGATHLVVGRPILAATDPGEAFAAISREAAGV